MLAYLHTLMVVFVVIGIGCLMLMIAITADMVYYYFHGYKVEDVAQKRAKKDSVRDQKELEAAQTAFFFDENWLEPYKPGFDNTGELYYRGKHLSGKHRFQQLPLIDKLVDGDIIETSEGF